MSLPQSVREAVEDQIGRITDVRQVGGGCIANASRVEADGGAHFLKWARSPAGDTFEAEAAGLQSLADASSPLLIPEVISVRNAHEEDPGHLLMAWIEPGTPDRRFSRRLGEGLARLHEAARDDRRFGFDVDNYIGRLPQANDWHSDWPTFFREMRLEPQIEMARQSGRWRPSWDEMAMAALDVLTDLLPRRPAASICHGDLWNGNVLCSADGRPALIDPAAYFGHGETDLAMMTLFGGFDSAVFDAYYAIHPKQPGHELREAVYQLYHLINHLNHFGEGYAGGVERTLQRLT